MGSHSPESIAPRARMVDAAVLRPESSALWRPMKVSKAEFDAEIARLSAGPRNGEGRREALITHPDSKNHSLTPGMRAHLEVILPGEEVVLPVENSSAVGLCLAGEGTCEIDGHAFTVGQYDIWSVPNMAAQRYANHGKTPHVRLRFTDAPLLEHLWAHFVDPAFKANENADYQRNAHADSVHKLSSGGGCIKNYHAFVDPEVVPQKPVYWRWAEVRAFLNSLDKNHPDLRAAIIALMWNPATGRTNGSTNTLTAWMSGGEDPNWKAPGSWTMARSHRHTVTAVNMSLMGRWRTVVEGQDILWEPGDMVITAPSWGRHSNGTFDRESYTFTVQDNALHAALNTSLMQEYLNRPPILLGSHPGFKA
jgi:gentisate 1,2-dioxygenase